MHANLPIAALLLFCLRLAAESGNMQAVREIWVPEGWSAPEVATSGRGRSHKPSTPAGFQTRKVGAMLHVNSVAVTRSRAGRSPSKVYTLLVGTREVPVSAGSTLRLDGKRYRVVGEQDGVLVLQDRRTKALLRFRKQEPPAAGAEDESTSSSDGKK